MSTTRRTEIELAKTRRHLAKAPWPRAKIEAVDTKDGKPGDLQLLVTFVIDHPEAPDQTGEMLLDGNSIYQFHEEQEDGRQQTQARRLWDPKEGMIGILRFFRDPRDGIKKHWQFIVDVQS